MHRSFVVALAATVLTAPVAAPAAAADAASAKPVSRFAQDPYASTYRPIASPAVLIRDATVLTGTGTRLDGADVLMRDGRIVAVGRDLDAPADAVQVDGRGKWVTPGLIDVHSHLGVYPSPGASAHSRSAAVQALRTGSSATDWVPVGSSSRTTSGRAWWPRAWRTSAGVRVTGGGVPTWDGGEIRLPAPGGQISDTLEAGSPVARDLRLAGKGFPGRGRHPAGDLFVHLQPVYPATLSARQRKLLRQANAALLDEAEATLPEIAAWNRKHLGS